MDPPDNVAHVGLEPFGFDGFSQECRDLYQNKLYNLNLDDKVLYDDGIYIGSLLHISPNAPCTMCQKLFAIRWSDSATDQYHLHAFSAAKMFCGTSIKFLASGLTPGKEERILEDNILLAVFPDGLDWSSILNAAEQYGPNEFLIACKIDSSGEQSPTPLVERIDYSSVTDIHSEDCKHHFWLAQTIGDRQKHAPLSIHRALQRARQNGFINEYKSLGPIALPGCYSTSISELQQRKDLGERSVNFLSVQPTETGDPNTPRNLGYIPHHVRPSDYKTLSTQTLQSEGFFGRAVDSATIDYSLLRGWIRQCHEKCDQDLRRLTRERKRFERVPFNLLDCTERRVFKVPSKRNHRYIALSYVWGDSNINVRPV